jgi:hypothetical protein
MFLPTHLDWAQDKVSGVEHVTLENFVKEFSLSDRQSATDSYTALIWSDEIRRQRREKLQEAFKEFRKHQEDIFWSRRKLQLSSEITSNDAAVDLQEAALKKSRKGYLEVSCHPPAGLKHSRDLVAELDETLPKIARNACKHIETTKYQISSPKWLHLPSLSQAHILCFFLVISTFSVTSIL